MSEIVNEFIDAMQKAGIGPDNPADIIADDTIRRYQVEGDRKGKKNGSYRLGESDGFGFGWFQSFKHGGETINWHYKTNRKWSQEEKDAHKKRVSDMKHHREQQREAALKTARDEAAKLWTEADKSGTSDYVTRKGITPRGVRYSGGDLVIPMWRDGGLVSVQTIKPDGFKLFQESGDIVGAYFSIKGEPDTIAICEGYATGARVAAVTGWSVIIAFTAGNLKPVAKSMRAKYPDARIVFAADNDHESTNAKGEPYNAGVEKSQQAAVAIGGAQVLIAPCEPGESDWDDVANRLGNDAVRSLLTDPPAPKREPEPDYEPDNGDWEVDYDPLVVDHEDPMTAIRPQGHNRGEYFFFPQTTGQIVSFSATALGRKENLYQLAPKGFWERLYAPEDQMTKICDYAAAELIDACHKKGIYSHENARGVGVWRDKGGKLLVNCGDIIVGEGVKCHPSQYDGAYVYEAGHRVIDMDVEPLTSKEAARFRGVCKSLTFKKPEYGDFIAGWCVIAGVGGALDWRPHIFITGQKGSGKSTAMDKIVKGSLDRICIKLDGGSTEPGIRGAIGASSRPFIMDEAEAETQVRKMQMQSILGYFRNASSGAQTANANASSIARSAACFGAINPRIEEGADADRWTILELVPNRGPDRERHYRELLKEINDVITYDFPDRLLTRTVANLDVLLHNIGVFTDVISEKLGSKRAGDQIGALLAGSYSLVSDKRVTYDFVSNWVDNQNWGWDELKGGGSDADKLVSYIMSARVRYDHEGMGRESTIGELVWRVRYAEQGWEAASRGLGSKGIKVVGDTMLIANSSAGLKGVLRETVWTDWKRVLSDYDGATVHAAGAVYFAPGVRSRATEIPLRGLLEVGEEEITGWDE